MKRMKIAMFAVLVFLIGGSLSAQDAKTAELEILTSAQCSMCKETIEKAMAFEKGVIKAALVVETKILKVTYKTAKTNPETIRKAVSAVGYDADDVAANPEAYNTLSDCCKKPEDQKSDHSGHKH